MERRKFDRVVVGIDIEISIRGLLEPVHLYDLSMDGCMIETSGAPNEAGDPVSIDLNGFTVEGAVIWSKGPCAGVQFASRLDEAVVAELGFRGAQQLSSEPFTDQFGRQLLSRSHRNMHVKLS